MPGSTDLVIQAAIPVSLTGIHVMRLRDNRHACKQKTRGFSIKPWTACDIAG
jgi:hypothetical protein